jgi:hypothetical protein
MTFIASVIAKKGVALIADSLVTSQMSVLPYRKFIEYLDQQPKDAGGQATINAGDIENLFIDRPMYTKDYEEKLFKLNLFTGITTTGAAYINDKNIRAIVDGFKAQQADIEDLNVTFNERLLQLSDYLNVQVREHLGNHTYMGFCTLMVTYYDKFAQKTDITKLIINEIGSDSLAIDGYNYVTLMPEQEWAKVVCDGQNKISENVLYGFGKTFFNKFPSIVNDIVGRLNLPKGTVPADFVNTLINDSFYGQMFYEDVEITNLSDLSLQQAVDLASLLMRLEVDFQKYTKTMPTVGGVIKLAVIDELGFRFILGDIIEPPKHIHL